MLNTRSSSLFRGRTRLIAATTAGAALLTAAAGCSTASEKSATSTAGATGTTGSSTKIAVVAAEDFWGSIAKQLGGDHVTETSVITNPDTDPHAYEPTAADGRAVASAQYVINNGVGYDAWTETFIASNPSPSRTVLTVGDLLGLKDGDNPHQWYSHDSVYKVIDQITADYKKLDPADAAYFDAQKQNFETTTLAKYNQLEADIKAKYAGTPIGASESIVSPLADSTGLKMLTPYSFLKAISEGTDVSAADKTTIDQQISGKQIKVYVYNSQNSTPDIATQVEAAKKAGIPVATVTETLTPAGTPFQDWQSAQLQSLESALAQATGK
ncbi:MAG: zinc ABC transporter substrate-binding protein [Streptomyces sp.]|uniref:metal ABC transporter solute-binding protein, Zn/Mn family n=1 Tax=Streptomyces sp. TaxID=1931 RepID=UPI0025F6D64C|nr:zinc ABC transporter substrate-binding protein [Streptomyces sp.]MBW8792393.1 zinc ABC transporter substrate-binding protein [Streptomyces sp.]